MVHIRVPNVQPRERSQWSSAGPIRANRDLPLMSLHLKFTHYIVKNSAAKGVEHEEYRTPGIIHILGISIDKGGTLQADL
jgi:hypothetical protein